MNTSHCNLQKYVISQSCTQVLFASLQSPRFTSKPSFHFKAHASLQSPRFTSKPMLHFKAHASLQSRMLHFKAACFTSKPMLHFKAACFTSMMHASYSMLPTHTTFCLVRSYNWLHRLLEQQVTHNYYPANQKRYRNNSNRTGDAATVTTKVTQTSVTGMLLARHTHTDDSTGSN